MKERQTWAEWHSWCRRYWLLWKDEPLPVDRELLAPPGVDRETFRRNAEWMERSQWPKCARAVESVAATGRWGPVPQDLRWLLAQRLLSAMEILSLLEFGKSPLSRPAPESGRHADILRWLLIGSWTDYGRNRWLERLVARTELEG